MLSLILSLWIAQAAPVLPLGTELAPEPAIRSRSPRVAAERNASAATRVSVEVRGRKDLLPGRLHVPQDWR